ncbi:cytoskeleton-associated protein 5 isoform X1 [Dermacentor andersoni]|uniref:cytoskeleton-associated protein 5 isoform X1 n=1 Tax=Dermacentor andersoni TaxID=34620 RepID=UPI0024173772|nr:cytoskeleton-associated protein 5-like isoform X1 [Dermacentor andersoni]
MADDTEYLKLPVEDRCQHKLWKARLSGYEDATKLFGSITDPKGPEFQKFLPLIKNFVTDSNAVSQEKGLAAVLSFVENAQLANRICGDVLAGLVAKCIAAPKQKTRELAQEIIYMYVEIEKQEVVVEELVKALDNKNPKIVSGCVATLRECLRLFGARVIAVKPLFKALPKLLEDRDKTVRDESKLLTVELYRWIGDALKPLLQSLKPVQVSELEAEFAKVEKGTALPERYIRSEQARRAQAAEAGTDSVDGVEEGDECGVDGGATIDGYDLLEAVDILSKLPKDFYEQCEAKKWQERKEALEKLLELTSNPKLEPGDYGDLVKALKRIVAKDSNVIVVALAAKCLAGLAAGLRQKFHPYANLCISTYIEKFKEKKQNVVTALREALDNAFQATNLEAILEDVTGALENKNPQIKAETTLFLARVFSKSTPAVLNKKLLKALVTSLLKTLNDSDPAVREGASMALGTAMKVVGERVLTPFLGDLDNLKMEKVKECCEKAEVVAAPPQKAPRKPAAAASPAKRSAEPKPEAPVQRKAATAVAKPRGGARVVRPGAASSTAPTSAPARAMQRAKASGPAKAQSGSSASSKPVFSEMALADEEVQGRAAALFPEESLTALGSANWKDRLAAVEKIKEVVEAMEGNLPVQVIAKTLCRKPGLRDTNFQVLKLKLETLVVVLGGGPVSLCVADCLLPDLVDKVGDIKNGQGAASALTALAEATSLDHVGQEALQLCFAQKNPKNQSESLMWLANAIKEFGLKVPVKPVIENIKKGLAASNPAVRTASITLAGVLYLYMGKTLRTLFEGEKATLVQQLDAELAKMEGQKPPAPIRGVPTSSVNDGGGDSAECAQEEQEAALDMEDLVPRTDISGQLTESLLSELSDKNWKVRQEALQKLAAIVDQAKFICPELGDLPASLRARLLDSNKNLAIQALNICQCLGVALGPHCGPYVRTLAPGMFVALGDSKNMVRAAALSCLNEWSSHASLGTFFENEMLKDALKAENPLLRSELFGWLAERLGACDAKGVPGAELASCLPQLYQCLEDRSGEVRKKAQDLLLPCMLHLGYESMARATSKLKASSKTLVMAQLDKVRPQLPAKVPPQGKATILRGGSSHAAAAPPPMAAHAQPTNHPEAVTPEEEQGAVGGSAGGRLHKSSSRSKQHSCLGSAMPVKPGSSGKSSRKEEEVDMSPLLSVNNLKEQRIAFERALKLLKWNFSTPREEFYQQLKEQMVVANWAPSLVANCFSADFKMHIKAIDMLLEFLSSSGGVEATSANVDLVLKWLTLRFFDTNPSVLLRALEYLQALFPALYDAGYKMHDLEASSFLPYLILKAGDPKDTVRKGVHDIFRRIYKVFPGIKVFNYLMQGLSSKNARQRAECLEELGFLFEVLGLPISEPTPPVLLKEVARHISDRDNAVRNAALNCVVQAYFREEERVFKYIGQLSDKDKSLLEERIKRASRTRRMTVLPPEESPPVKNPTPPRPQSAVFASATMMEPEPEPEEVVHRRPKSGTPSGARPRSLGVTLSSDLERMLEQAALAPSKVAGLQEVDADAILAEPSIQLPPRRCLEKSASPPSHARRLPLDTDSFGNIISRLTSQEIAVVLEGLAQLDTVLATDGSPALLGGADQLVNMMSLQYRLLHTKHITDDCVAKADVIELYSRMAAVLLKVFDGRTLGRRVSTGVLKELLPQLLMVLLDKRITEFRHGPHLQRTVNILALHIIRNGNPSCVLSALITHLHDCLGNMSTQASEKYIDLVVKCLWKMMSSLENIVDELSLDLVLLDLHLFLKAYRGSFWEGRPSDTPLRTVRTIIYKLVGLKGHKLLTYAEMVPGQEESSLVNTITKMLKMHARKSAEISANKGFSDDSQNKSNDESEQKSVHQQFKNVMHKLSSEDDFDENIQVLHRLCKKNPGINVDQLYRSLAPHVRELVRTRLNELERQPPGSNVAHVLPLRMNDTNRHSYSSSPRKGDLSKLPKDYMHWNRKQWATRLNAVLDQLNVKGHFSNDDYPSSEDIPDIFSEPLHVHEARYQQIVQQSEDLTKTAQQIIADLRNRGRSPEESHC